jgi:hypothetical protein
MADTTLRSELIDFFNETQRAHHRAYFDVDGFDLEWPIWYADYMQARLNGLIHAVCTRSELVYLLVMVEKERLRQPPGGIHWADFYADFFVERYGAMSGHMPAEPAAGLNEDNTKP